jgi:hypothetical protein
VKDHLLIVRIRSAEGFKPTRESLRQTIASGLHAWPVDLELVSLSPIPRDRMVKARRAPTKRSFPLLDFIKGD